MKILTLGCIELRIRLAAHLSLNLGADQFDGIKQAARILDRF